jgi:exodeoxyribonuclease VII small subunit
LLPDESSGTVGRWRVLMEEGLQAKRPDVNSPAFEDILTRLNTVVERLESGDMPLEESLALFEEGVRLSRLGSARLDDAERRVERLLHHDGTTEVIAGLSDPNSSEVSSSQKENEVP